MLKSFFQKEIFCFCWTKNMAEDFLDALTGLKAVLKNMFRGFSEKKFPA